MEKLLNSTENYDFFYQNGEKKGKCSLTEFVEKIETGECSLSTWVRKNNEIYWGEARTKQEILSALSWVYIVDGIEKKIVGSELYSLYQNKLIGSQEYIRLAIGEKWEKIWESSLIAAHLESRPKSIFKGFYSRPPCFQTKLMHFIDKWGLIIILLTTLFKPNINYFFIAVLINTGLQALSTYMFGSTLGGMITRHYVLTSEGKKLGFYPALKRSLYQSFTKKGSLKNRFFRDRFGLDKFDVENNIILKSFNRVNEKPFSF